MTIEGSQVHRAAMSKMTEWFDKSVMQHVIRSSYVEFQIGALLGQEWEHVGRDWGGWDFQRGDTRLEVKHSAARQSWNPAGKSSRASFDIAPRTGYYDGAIWRAEPGRLGHLYVFAWHGVVDDACDQRDESQWTYFVVKTSALPDQKTIALSRLDSYAKAVAAAELRAEANRVADEIGFGAKRWVIS